MFFTRKYCPKAIPEINGANARKAGSEILQPTPQKNLNFAAENLIDMSKKHQGRGDGLVYSTNQDFYNDFEPEFKETETLPKEKQKLRVKLDTKQRAGKVVTLVDGFMGMNDDIEALGKQLKTKCGTGGSVKDGLIIIQGDYREKILTWLKDWGYVLAK